MIQPLSFTRPIFIQVIRKSSILLFSIVIVQLTFQGFGQKLTVIDSLETVLKKTMEEKGKVDVLNVLSHELNLHWEMDEALRYAEEALTVSGKTLYKNGEAEAMMNIGSIQLDLRKFDQAEATLTKSLALSLETGDQKDISGCYILLGRLNSELRKYNEALKYFDLANKISSATVDRKAIAECSLETGKIRIRLDEYPEAYRKISESKKIYEEIRYPYGIIEANIISSELNSIIQEYPESKKNVTVCLKILESAPNLKQEADVYFRAADYYWDLFDLSTSMDYLMKAKAIYQNLKTDHDLGRCCHMISAIYTKWNKFSDALDNVQIAIKIFQEEQSRSLLVNALIAEGDVYFRMGGFFGEPESQKNFMEADKSYSKAIEIASSINDKHGVWMGKMRLFHLDSLIGRYDLALLHYISAKKISDSVFNMQNSKLLGDLMVKYETEKKDKEIAMLNKENGLKALLVESQKAILLTTELEMEKERLQLLKTQEDLEHQKIEIKAQAIGKELMTKENEMKETQLNQQKLIRNIILAGIVLLMILAFLVYRSMHLRKKLEKQQAIIHERKRISADLHDDIGSGLSKISLLGELVKQKARTPEAKVEAEKIAATSRELLDNIREIIWALNTNNDYLENLVSYIRRYAAEYFENASVKLKIMTPPAIPETFISGEYRRNVFFSVKEAMHNVIRHAGATEAELGFSLENGIFSVSVRDNGKGLPEGELNRFGSGLKNMKTRMEAINGCVIIENGAGTKITLNVPV